MNPIIDCYWAKAVHKVKGFGFLALGLRVWLLARHRSLWERLLGSCVHLG